MRKLAWALLLAGENSTFVDTFSAMNGTLLRTVLDEEKSAAVAKAVNDAANAQNIALACVDSPWQRFGLRRLYC